MDIPLSDCNNDETQDSPISSSFRTCRSASISFPMSHHQRCEEKGDILLEPIYLTAPIADPPPIPYNKLLLAQGKSPIWLKSSLTDILFSSAE
jgi:hypothetical protein